MRLPNKRWIESDGKMNSESEARDLLVRVCKEVYEREMVSSSGGNISMRFSNGLLITPSGYSLGKLVPEDLVKASIDGKVIGLGKPSKEFALHTGVYQVRPDVTAVVHVHTPYAVCVSCMIAKKEFTIPAMTPGYVIRVGDLPVVPFYAPSTPQLAESVQKVLRDRNSVLLSKHGIVTVGKTMQEAINLAEEVEENAKIFVLGGIQAEGLTEPEKEAIRNLYA